MQVRRELKLLVGGAVATVAFAGFAMAGAASSNLSHSYNTADKLTNGSLVSLAPGKSDVVNAANTNNASQLIGVAVSVSDSLLAVNPSSGNGTAQVATGGNASVLVSDVNGTIKVGDQVAVSPFDGVGMKASPATRIIGLAQSNFSKPTTGDSTRQVTDKNGKTQDIQLGYVKVVIGIGNATAGSDQDVTGLQKIIQSLTGHNVSLLRAILALSIAIIAGLSLVTIIYAAIYGGIISVGRNPLAKYAIFRGLTSVLGMAALTAAVATLTIFLLLR